MAVSAEISATVIRARTKSSMRKNCRIAEDYIVPIETRLAASFAVFSASPQVTSRG
jgi:hypothetical protein